MMPTYRVTVLLLTGQVVTYWTQDPEGLAASCREHGAFVSTDTPREDPPKLESSTGRRDVRH
jgi:hypothetical protein